MRTGAILAATLAIVFFAIIGGCAQQEIRQADTVEYMGFTYGPSRVAVLPDRLYYTGDAFEGAKLYAEGGGRPEKVPLHLAVKDARGEWAPYSRMANGPTVYAYTPYSQYNLGEPVTFGLMDEAGGSIELRNAAPWEIRKKESGGWRAIFQPVAAQVITPLENGTYREWTWDQRYDDGKSKAGAGEYAAVIDGRYAVNFTISPGAPVVRPEAIGYDNSSLRAAFLNAPERDAFAGYYHGYSQGQRNDTEGLMLFKAWMAGLDADRLRTALKAAGDNAAGLHMLPCLAVHASYGGRPAWVIVYNWGMEGEGLSHIRYYVVDDGTGKIVYSETCR